MEKERGELKHLGFVREAALKTLVCLSNLYDYAKNNSGPLKPAVNSVESAVTAVVAPLYHKYNTVPSHLVFFLDHKVDEANVKLKEQAPPAVKKVASHVHLMFNKATATVQELLHQAQVGGLSAAARYAASESKELVVNVWKTLDRVPPVHTMTQMALPTLAHWSHRYNNAVIHMQTKGYAAFQYLPMIPVESIAKAFKQAEE